MTKSRSYLLLLLAGLSMFACAPEAKPSKEAQHPASTASDRPVRQDLAWVVPSALPVGELRASVQRGEALITQTAKYLGPDVADPAKRIAGNHLSCKNCHLNAGKQANALGYIGITARFPQYRGRENREVSLAERVNGCFERSLNGRTLAEDSQEMKDILAYMQWLSQGIPKGAKMQGQGIPKLDVLERAASPDKGKLIFSQKCALCHQPTGAGLPVNAKNLAEGYLYPPLWGKDSFNNGAGMARLITAAQYIKANMPFGNPSLTNEEAFDVAAFINSQPRPQKSGLENDFPDRSKKPVDAPFPPWPDHFSEQQHKYGPFKPMLKHSSS